MVVCMVVRVRNVSNRTYYIVQAGDPFYSPKIGGQATGDEPFEVPPGFDEAAEGLVIPWAATSRCGFVLGEASSAGIIRCVVGPADRDEFDTDWLRFHDAEWRPIVEDRWLSLGKRHLIGFIGGTVDIALTFRENRRHPQNDEYVSLAFDDALGRFAPTSSPRSLLPEKLKGTTQGTERIAESAHFELEAACAPSNTVFLNVFDLASVASIPNSMLCNTMMKSFGAFHAAVEVYGEEWSFYKQANPLACGIYRSEQPRRHPVHVYRQSVNLGVTTLKDFEVMNIIRREVLPQWPSGRYDLIHCNCIHFCDAFLSLLGVQQSPSWVKGLHETGAALLRPLSVFSGGSGTKPADAERGPPQGHQSTSTGHNFPVASRALPGSASGARRILNATPSIRSAEDSSSSRQRLSGEEVPDMPSTRGAWSSLPWFNLAWGSAAPGSAEAESSSGEEESSPRQPQPRLLPSPASASDVADGGLPRPSAEHFLDARPPSNASPGSGASSCSSAARQFLDVGGELNRKDNVMPACSDMF